MCIWRESYNAWPFSPGFLHLAYVFRLHSHQSMCEYFILFCFAEELIVWLTHCVVYLTADSCVASAFCWLWMLLETPIYKYLLKIFITFRYILKNSVLGLGISSILLYFWRTTKLLFIVGALFYIPTCKVLGFQFFYIFTQTY